MNSKILNILHKVCLPMGKLFPRDLDKKIRASPWSLLFLKLW